MRRWAVATAAAAPAIVASAAGAAAGVLSGLSVPRRAAEQRLDGGRSAWAPAAAGTPSLLVMRLLLLLPLGWSCRCAAATAACPLLWLGLALSLAGCVGSALRSGCPCVAGRGFGGCSGGAAKEALDGLVLRDGRRRKLRRRDGQIEARQQVRRRLPQSARTDASDASAMFSKTACCLTSSLCASRASQAGEHTASREEAPGQA